MKAEDVYQNLPTLETPRLILRKLTMADAPDMFEYASDPEVARYVVFAAHRSIEDARAFIGWTTDRYQKGELAGWGIEHKSARKLIGTAGFGTWDTTHKRAEIAYALSRLYWNQGLMTEAVREILAFGFRRMELHRVQATCAVENVASARVLEKVGLRFEGTLRGYMLKKGTLFDQKMYAILRDEWLQSEAASSGSSSH